MRIEIRLQRGAKFIELTVDELFLQGTKENKVLRGDLVIRALKEMTDSVQIHVSQAKVPQDHLVYQDLQDPEACVGFQDHRGLKA